MKYHGNYCGQWWSAGKVQESVDDPSVAPVDEFDAMCMEHDRRYATGEDTLEADKWFVRTAYWHSNKANLAALAMVPQIVYKELSRNVDLPMNKSAKKTRSRASPMMAPAPTKAQTKQQQNDAIRVAPVAIATTRTSTAPRMQYSNNGIVKLSHRAFIQPITSVGNYTAVKVPCNPGLAGSFPWLSSLARKYDMYRFTRLRYSYRSVAPTSTPGVVMFSFDYDAADDVPTSKSKQAQTVPCTESNCWTSLDLSVQLDQNWKYVRPGALSSNLDIKTYDSGNLIYSTQYGSGIVTGELYVEYTVELKKPSDGSTDTGLLACTTSAFASPFNIVSTISGFIPVSRISATTLQFLASGEYFVVCNTLGTTMTAAASTPTIATSGSGAVAFITSAVSPNLAILVFKVRSEVGDVLTFANAGTGATVTSFSTRFALADYDTML